MGGVESFRKRKEVVKEGRMERLLFVSSCVVCRWYLKWEERWEVSLERWFGVRLWMKGFVIRFVGFC